MNLDFNDLEYNEIVKDILENKTFKKLDLISHHGTTRLSHSLRVSYFSYLAAKKLNLDYISVARAGLLHDFFLNIYEQSNGKVLLKNHPLISVYNSKKFFDLNILEEDIIVSHMYPVNLKYKPRYKESYLVSIIDKMAFVYERSCFCKRKFLYQAEKLLVCFIILFGI